VRVGGVWWTSGGGVVKESIGLHFLIWLDKGTWW
jgi:hypothetical protein